MSGHSKWNNIKGTKGVADAKRGALFSKISKDIIMATQMGGSGDVNFNMYLRVLIAKAKSSNMPSDKIERAINKGLGKKINGEDNVVEKTYEAYGFGGAAILIDCETDNPNRSVAEVRTIITRVGGKLVPEGSISWQFEEMGRILFKVKNKAEIEDIALSVISIDGVTDVFEDELEIEVYVKREFLKSVTDSIKESLNGKIEISEISIDKIAKEKVSVSEDDMEKNSELINKIKEYSEVIEVWTNIA